MRSEPSKMAGNTSTSHLCLCYQPKFISPFSHFTTPNNNLSLSLPMAPPKKNLPAAIPPSNKNLPAEVATGRRVTRSLTRRSDSPAAPPPPQQPPTKKAKKAKVSPKVPATEDGEDTEAVTKEEVVLNEKVSGSRTIVIERCTQCQCFKKGAEQVKEGLEKAITGISVLINPEKPRRGCFEVREEGGETFISLQGLTRPFKTLKDLDKEQLTVDIVAKLKS